MRKRDVLKDIFIVLSIIIIVAITIAIPTKLIVKEIEKDKSYYEAQIGKEIIINKDTLTIVNYSLFEETFTLSSGLKVDRTIIFK